MGDDELQYLRDGLFKQLVWMVELKSGGGYKFLRSSITDEDERVAYREVEMLMKKRLRDAEIAAMKNVFLWVFFFSFFSKT